MSDARPSPTVSTALYLPTERIPREPLLRWSERLRGNLDRFRREIRDVRLYADRVADASNNTGLIAASHGAGAVAREVCESQIRWAYRLGRRARNTYVQFFGVQAWTNLGRLDSLSGNWKGALDRFATLRDFEAASELVLDCVRVDGRTWHSDADKRRSFVRELEYIQEVDSLKALLHNRRFDETLAFAARLAPDAPGAPVAREAEVVAAAGVGDLRGACRLATEGVRSAPGWGAVVFRLRLGEVLTAAGDPGRAAEVLAPLAAKTLQVAPGRKNLYALNTCVRLAAVCREAGLDAEAAALAADVREAAIIGDDEVFRIESLRVLAAASPPEARPAWRDELSRAEEATEYRRFRRDPSRGVHPEIGALFDQLREILATA